MFGRKSATLSTDGACMVAALSALWLLAPFPPSACGDTSVVVCFCVYWYAWSEECDTLSKRRLQAMHRAVGALVAGPVPAGGLQRHMPVVVLLCLQPHSGLRWDANSAKLTWQKAPGPARA